MSVRTFCRQAAVVAVVACLWPSPAEAQSARVMYESALAREQAVRSQLDRGRQVTRTEILTIVTSYERVVRRFPGSGYSDNALWQGSGLALTAFERFANPRDQRTAVRLLRDLRAGYPSSSLMPKVRDQLAQLETTSAPPAVRNAGATSTPSSAPVARAAASAYTRRRATPHHQSASRGGLDHACRRHTDDSAHRDARHRAGRGGAGPRGRVSRRAPSRPFTDVPRPGRRTTFVRAHRRGPAVRQRHGSADSRWPAPEHCHPRGSRFRRDRQLQRVSVVQPVSPRHRLPARRLAGARVASDGCGAGGHACSRAAER